jgi:hypothetical protein
MGTPTDIVVLLAQGESRSSESRNTGSPCARIHLRGTGRRHNLTAGSLAYAQYNYGIGRTIHGGMIVMSRFLLPSSEVSSTEEASPPPPMLASIKSPGIGISASVAPIATRVNQRAS